jgi:hypothetical protein
LSTAPDVVYSFTLPVAAKVSAKVTSTGWMSAVTLRSNCGGTRQVNQIVCATGAVAAVANALHPGTYFVWVDGSTPGASGTFQLDLTLDNPAGTPPVNDTCAGALPLTLGVAANGDTTYAVNDYDWGYSNAAGCEPAPSPPYDGMGADLVWSYTPSVDGAFKVAMGSIICNPSPFTVDMWIGADTCGDPRTCLGGIEGGGPVSVTVNGVANRTYYIYAEGRQPGSVCQFTVSVTAP